MADPAHPLMLAIHPLLTRIGAAIVDPPNLRADDIPLEWDGYVVAGIRLPTVTSATSVPAGTEASGAVVAGPDSEQSGGLDSLLADVETQLGGPLSRLDRIGKQRAVRILEESGAFSYRKSVEAVAAALGISRFTVYNYLNRDRG